MKLLSRKWATVFALPIVMLASAMPAHAETSKKDIQIASRAVAFMTSAPTGAVTAAVVYDPANPASKVDADAIVAAIGGGLKAGKATLSAKLVATDNLADMTGARVAFIADGTGAQHAAIFADASAQSILVISTDMSCVDAGNCIVGVASKPKVSIVVSKAARAAAGIDFKPAFLMMVKEK